VRHDGATAQERSGQVDLDDAAPEIERKIHHRRALAGDAGGVHQDVDAVVFCNGLGGAACHCCLVGHVELGNTSVRQRRLGGVQRARIKIPQHHRRAGLVHALRGDEADSAGPAGDDGDAVGKVDLVHVVAIPSCDRGG
jgi:hypothetical protein